MQVRPGFIFHIIMNRHNELSMGDYILLVVNPTGHIREIYCPFRVICIEPVGIFKAGTVVWVERVTFSPTHEAKILYQIYGRLYVFECFVIQIQF